MGFMDKVKQTASQMATEAKKGTTQIQERVEQGKIRKRADEAAKKLGYLIVRERTEGVAAGAEGDVLVDEIISLEKQLEAPPNGAGDEGGATGEAGTA